MTCNATVTVKEKNAIYPGAPTAADTFFRTIRTRMTVLPPATAMPLASNNLNFTGGNMLPAAVWFTKDSVVGAIAAASLGPETFTQG